MLYDVIIIGSGPAGLSAAIYAERAKLKTLVLEKAPMSGGQILNTYEVDNYPGIPGVGGFDLGSKFRAHADAVGCQFVTAEVLEIKDKDDHISQWCDTPDLRCAGGRGTHGNGSLLLCHL